MTAPTHADAVTRPCGSREFRTFMSQWPTGVTVVTTAEGDTPVGCTVNAMMSVSLSPTLLVVALTNGTRTLNAVRRCGMFALNLLSAHQRHLCRRFATPGIADRFDGVAHHWHCGVPLLDDVKTSVGCEVRELRECGDHTLVVGAPLWHNLSMQDEPLVFYHSTYRELAQAEAGDGAS